MQKAEGTPGKQEIELLPFLFLLSQSCTYDKFIEGNVSCEQLKKYFCRSSIPIPARSKPMLVPQCDDFVSAQTTTANEKKERVETYVWAIEELQ